MTAIAAPSPIDATSAEVIPQQWVCMVCGLVYDSTLGLPDEGIPAGTRFQDIPDDWYCPDCGVTKADFEPLVF